MKRKFHVISNTHWDREWRFPFQRNRQMLVDMIDRVLEILEDEPEYRAFHLDSQAIVLKDYLEIRPYKKDLITKLVSEKRLLIGPWYILPEEFQVGGENLIRNLLLGHKVCRENGGVSKIGYSPFSWGQISQLPQLYKEFNINLIMFYRGVNSKDSKKSEFIWVGADGTSSITSRFSTMPRYNFYFYIYRPVVFNQGFYDVEHPWNKFGQPFHFADKEQMEEDYFILNPEKAYYKENLSAQVNAIIKDQADDFTTPHVVWMEGHDSSGPNAATVRIIKDIKEEFPELDVVHSTLEDYADSVYKAADVNSLQVVEGERRSAQYDNRSGNLYGYTTSARMYLKQKNFDAERWVQFYAEPFNVFSGIFGRDIRDNYLNISWEYIIQNSAHDSIGGCSLDEIHDDMMNRYKQAIEISKGVFERAIKHIASRIDTYSFREKWKDSEVFITIVNPNNFKRNEVVELFIDIPQKIDTGNFSIITDSGEYLQYEIISSEAVQPVLEQMINRPMYFDMQRYHVQVLVDGIEGFSLKTLAVLPAENSSILEAKKQIIYSDDMFENEFLKIKINKNGTVNILHKKSGKEFTEQGYLYDEGEGGHAWVNIPEKPIITTLNSEPKINIVMKTDLMATVSVKHVLDIPLNLKERKANSGIYTKIDAEIRFSITAVSEHVEIEVNVNNRAESHRLRIMFPTHLQAEHSYGEGQFDVVKRSLARPDTSNWIEQPMYDFPMHNFVDISDGNVGAAILVDGLKEYEVLNDSKNTVAITLFRSFDYIIAPSSKQDYTWQKGAQSLGRSSYRLAFYPHEEDWNAGEVYREAQNFNVKIRGFQTGLNEGDLPTEFSFLRIKPESLNFSALKIAENGDGYILRLFNPVEYDVSGEVMFLTEIISAKKTTLEEIDEEEITIINGNSIKLTVGAKKIVSIRLNLRMV